MTTREDLLVAAGPSVDPGRWPGVPAEPLTRVGGRFRRVEPRRRARAFVLGLLAELPGHTLTGRELYLPGSWAGNEERCAAAGIPGDVKFATKPELARRMIERSVTAAVLFTWVAGDEVYGDNGPLRTWLEAERIAHVLAVACDHRVPAGAGHALRADQPAARLPRRAWQPLSAGPRAKGHRWYDWAWVTVSGPGPADQVPLTRNEIAHLLAGTIPPPGARRRAPDALVPLATPPPAPRPDLPLPAADNPGPGHITIYGWIARQCHS